MKRISVLFPCFAIILSSLFVPSGNLSAAPAKISTEDMLWEHLMRRSEVWFDESVRNSGTADPGEWRVPIENALSRLSAAGSINQDGYHYAVLAVDEFNAGCFPGGQIIINRGMLTIFDILIKRDAGNANRTPEEIQMIREMLIAPVLAHEYGHYINKHVYKSIRMMWAAGSDVANLTSVQAKYSQQNEFEADATGVFLLQRARYNPALMGITLEIINSLGQGEDQKFFGVPSVRYTKTHPSGHARLAALKGDNYRIHEWAAGLERAFDDVQIGRNLQNAATVLLDAVGRFPENPYFQKVYAAALHKKWLATVSISDQKFRGIIDVPSFRDEMVFSQRSLSRGRKVIPGDVRLFYAARTAYENALKTGFDPGLYSNYGILLCYSTDKADEDRAVELCMAACNAKADCTYMSNCAVALYMTGKRTEAAKAMISLAAKVNSDLQGLLSKAGQDDQQAKAVASQLVSMINGMQNLDPSYVYANVTPILNAALMLNDLDLPDEAKLLAGSFLSNYDRTSLWAKYLAKETGTRIPASPSVRRVDIDGITVGTTLNDIVARWGKPDQIATDNAGNENWMYSKKSVFVQMEGGAVTQISLYSKNSPALDKVLRVGSSRKKIESVFGKALGVQGQYYVYGVGIQKMIVQYVADSSIQIDLLQ